MVLMLSSLLRIYRDNAAVFRVSSLEIDVWFSSLHFLHPYREGAALFKLASLEMGTWLSSHHLWCLNRNGATF